MENMSNKEEENNKEMKRCTQTHRVMYVTGVVTLTTPWGYGLAAGVWNFQPLGQVLFLPVAVFPVLKQVCTTAFVLQTSQHHMVQFTII